MKMILQQTVEEFEENWEFRFREMAEATIDMIIYAALLAATVNHDAPADYTKADPAYVKELTIPFIEYYNSFVEKTYDELFKDNETFAKRLGEMVESERKTIQLIA